jgi:hypothetical protein
MPAYWQPSSTSIAVAASVRTCAADGADDADDADIYGVMAIYRVLLIDHIAKIAVAERGHELQREQRVRGPIGTATAAV